MIEIKNLTKLYGVKKAVDDISFTVNRGEVLGFLGPNGAGKTTTMNIITGYGSATSGTVTVDGFDVVENPMECKKRIGYLPEQPPLYMDMTVSEYLDFVYDIKGVKENRKAHMEAIVELVKISDVYHRLIKNLSKGYKQRVGIAQALIGNPEILILDEPTVGLDPKQIIEIRNVIKELGKDRTVILSSHILPEVNAICERVIIINKGKIMAIDTPENLAHKLSGDNKFVLRAEGKKFQIEDALKAVPGILYIESLGQKEEGTFDFLIESENGKEIRKSIFTALVQADLPILSFQSQDMSLEDVFLQLTEDQPVSGDVADSAEELLPDAETPEVQPTDDLPQDEEMPREEQAEENEEVDSHDSDL